MDFHVVKVFSAVPVLEPWTSQSVKFAVEGTVIYVPGSIFGVIPKARVFPDVDVTPLLGVNRSFGSSFSLVPTLGITPTPTPTFFPCPLDGLSATPLSNNSVPLRSCSTAGFTPQKILAIPFAILNDMLENTSSAVTGFFTSDSTSTVTSLLFSSS